MTGPGWLRLTRFFVSMILRCKEKLLDLHEPRVMGILNVTPDSFSDGGRFLAVDAAVEQALRMEQEGAAIIDVGGESTRPGAPPVTPGEELDRVIPVIEGLAPRLTVPISIDTSKPEVMRAAVAAGAGMINDVNALRAEGALDVARQCAVPVCLMHMRGEPRTMQDAPAYGDVVRDVTEFLAQRLAACRAAGIPREQLIVDPGFGFGKTLAHNLALLAGLQSLQTLEVPLLVGMSRKSMIGSLTGKDAGERLYGGLAAAVPAVERGARIVRVHDVGPTVDAMKVVTAVRAAGA